MKKIIVVFAMLLSLETLYGQEFQAGLKTGVGTLLCKKDYENIAQPVWSNEFSLRYESKRHFAIEVGLLHSIYQQHYTEHWEWEYEDFAGNEPYGERNVDIKKTVNRISPIISFQYKIYNNRNNYRLFNKFAASIGVHLAPTWIRTKSTQTWIDDANTKKDDYLSTFSTLIFGINSNFSYKLNYHWNLSGKVMASAGLYELFDGPYYSPNDRGFQSEISFTGLLGLNYKF